MKKNNIKECLALVMFIELVSFDRSSIFDLRKCVSLNNRPIYKCKSS